MKHKYNEGQKVYKINWIYENDYCINGTVEEVEIVDKEIHSGLNYNWYHIVGKNTPYCSEIENALYETKKEALEKIKNTLKRNWELLKNLYKNINKKYCQHYIAIQNEIENNLNNN